MRVTCVICSDLFDEVSSIVVAPCGHVFHEECIYQWVNRSSTCPECRQKVTFATVKKLYFSISSTQQVTSTNHLENEVHSLQAKLKEKDIILADVRKEKEEIRKFVRVAEEKAEVSEQKFFETKAELTTLRLVMKDLKKKASKVDELEEINGTLFRKIEQLQNVEAVISGTEKDVDNVIAGLHGNPDAVRQMATYFSLLKRELKSVSESKHQIQNQTTTLQKNLSVQSVKVRKQAEEIKLLREQVQILEKENLVLAKQARNAHHRKTTKATVSYESPQPERLKRSSETNIGDNSPVTPISERVVIEPLAKSQKLSGVSRPSLSSIHISNGFEVKMSEISNLRRNIKDNEGTSVRLGYDGLGGHGKFIVRSTKGMLKNSHQKKK